LAKQHDVEIRFNDTAIRKSGISLDLPISASGSEITLDEALTKILRKYGLNQGIDARGVSIEPSPPPPPSVPLVVSADAVPLRELASKLAWEYRIEIRFEAAVLRKAGIALDLPITADIRSSTLEGALGQALMKYGLYSVGENVAC